MKLFNSLAFLAWNLVVVLVVKFVGLFKKRRPAQEVFETNFQQDHLWALTSSQQKDIFRFSHCTQCGICNNLVAEAQPKTQLLHVDYTPPQEVIVGASRNLPTIELVASLFAPYQEQLEQLEQACPARIPFQTIHNLSISKKATD